MEEGDYRGATYNIPTDIDNKYVPTTHDQHREMMGLLSPVVTTPGITDERHGGSLRRHPAVTLQGLNKRISSSPRATFPSLASDLIIVFY